MAIILPPEFIPTFERINEWASKAEKRYGLPEGSIYATPHNPIDPNEVQEGNPSLYDIYIKNGQDYGGLTIGFNNSASNPFIRVSPTYSITSGGYLPYNYNTKENRVGLFNFSTEGGNKTNVVSPWEHLMQIMAYSVRGGEGLPETIQGRLNQAIFNGLDTEMNGFQYHIPGFVQSFSPQTSNERMRAIENSILPVLQKTEQGKLGFNYEQNSRSELIRMINGQEVQGILPGEKYASVEYKNSHLFMSQSSIGIPEFNTNGLDLGFGSNVGSFGPIDKAVTTGQRDIDLVMQVSNGSRKAGVLPESEFYHRTNMTINKGEIAPVQLFENVAIPFSSTELPTQSGASVEQMPAGLRSVLNSQRSHLEVGFQSFKTVPIENVRDINDLFYTDENGQQQFRINLRGKYTPEALEKNNVLQAGSRSNIAVLSGSSGNQDLGFSIKERNAALLSTSLVIPDRFIQTPGGQKAVIEKLLPELQKRGIGLDFAPIAENENGSFNLKFGANIIQFEGGSTKGGPSSKVTSTPMGEELFNIRQMVNGVPAPIANGNIDAVLPVKRLDVAMMNAFSGMSNAKQVQFLSEMAGENEGLVSQIQGYYNELGQNTPALRDIASSMGTSPISLVRRMSDFVVGSTPLMTKDPNGGLPVINQEVQERQDRLYNTYGIGLSTGYLPFDLFTKETMNQRIESSVTDLMRDNPNMKEAEARKLTSQMYAFTPYRQLDDKKTMLYAGYTFNEFLRANNMPINKVIEYSGEFNDTLDQLGISNQTTGNIDLNNFQQQNPVPLSGAQKAARERYQVYGANILGKGMNLSAITVSDNPTKGNAYQLNRNTLMDWVAQAQNNASSPAQQLEYLKGMVGKEFGEEALNMPFRFRGDSRDAFTTSINTTLASDKLDLQLSPDDEGDIQSVSTARVSENYMQALSSLSANDSSFEDSSRRYNNFLERLVSSKTTVQSRIGAYGAYGVSGALQNGEIAISNDALKRLYRLQGGTGDKSGFRSFLDQVSQQFLAVVERQPVVAGGTPEIPGNILTMSALTEKNSPIARALFKMQRQSGMKGQDFLLSPALKSLFGDADADKVGTSLLIAMATGENNQERGEIWKRFMPNGTESSLQERVAKVVSDLSPEKQYKVMDTIVGTSDPYSEAGVNAIKGNIGADLTYSLLQKRAIENTAESWTKEADAVSEQKSAMGNVYNQMLRNIRYGGVFSGREPISVERMIANSGSGLYASAVDKRYEDQSIVDVLRNAYVAPFNKGASLTLGFNSGGSNKSGFIFNNRTSFNDAFSSLVSTMLGENEGITNEGFAMLLNSGFERSNKSLSPEESYELSNRQLESDEDLAVQIAKIRKMDDSARPDAVRKLVKEGKIGINSAFGQSLIGRLSQYMENLDTSTDQGQKDKAANIRAAAEANGINIDEMLAPGREVSRAYEMSKMKGGNYQNPVDLAETLWSFAKSGVSDDPSIQAETKYFGSLIGASFESGQKGRTYLKIGATGDVIKNQKQFNNWKRKYSDQVDLTSKSTNANNVQSSSLPASSIPVQAGGSAGGNIPPTTPSSPAGVEDSGVPPTSPQPQSQPQGQRGFSPNFYRDQYSQGYIDFITGDFLDKASVMDERGANNALWRLGNPSTEDGEIPSYMIAPIPDMQPIYRYQQLVAGGNRDLVHGFMRNNPRISRQISSLRKMSKEAPYVFANTNSGYVHDLAGAMVGDKQSWSNLEESHPWITDILPFANMSFGKGDSPLDEDSVIKSVVESNLAQSDLYKAQIAYRKNASVQNRMNISSAQLRLAKSSMPELMSGLTNAENELQVKPELRVSSLNFDSLKNGQDYETAINNLVSRKNQAETLYGNEYQNVLPHVEKIFANLREQGGYRSEIDSDMNKVSKMREEISTEGVASLAKKFGELGENLDKVTPALKQFHKDLEDGTEIRKQALQENRGNALKAIETGRSLLGGDISDQSLLKGEEIDRLKQSSAGRELLSDYNKAMIGVTGADDGSINFGSAARRALGGFGLMYMRSIAGVISESGQFGFDESTQLNQGISSAMAAGFGAQGSDQMVSNLSTAKAAYGGGGQRFFNQIYNNLLRSSPSLVNTGNALIAGIGGFGATAWAGENVLGLAAEKVMPAAVGVGAAVALGSMATNQWGQVSDQDAWLAQNYQNIKFTNGYKGFSLQGGTYNPDTGVTSSFTNFNAGWNNVWNVMGVTASNIIPSLKQSEWYKNYQNNLSVASNMQDVDKLVSSGMTTTDAIKQLQTSGKISSDDAVTLSKAYASLYVQSDTPSLSQAGKMTAQQAYETFYPGQTADKNKDYPWLNKLAAQIDAGINTPDLVQSVLSSGGMAYNKNAGDALKAFANANLNNRQSSEVNTIASWLSNMGAGFTQTVFGANPEQLSKSIINSVTSDGLNLGNVLQGPNSQAFMLREQNLWAFGQAGDASAITAAKQVPGIYGTTNATDQQALLNQQTYLYNTTAGIQELGQKSGQSVTGIMNYWNKITNQGTITAPTQSMMQFSALVSNPSAYTFGVAASQLSEQQRQAFYSGTTMTLSGPVSNQALAFTGVDQGSFTPNGMSYGQASLGTPYATPQQMANNIWGSNWQTAYGSAGNAINAMVNGYTVNGTTMYGQYALQGYQNEVSYKQAMASAGIQMQGAQLSYAFTTGVGLSNYSTTNPVTGNQFNISGTGGFWGIEDQQISLSRAQQAYSFDTQQRSINMQNNFFNQNAALQWKGMQISHENNVEDLGYQQMIMDQQWGWHQQDYAENVRFLTGRQRMLAQRQEQRDTISHNEQEDRLDVMKKREQENWRLEDERFQTSKKQHQEEVQFQQEQLDKSKEFYAQSMRLEDQSRELQRAYFIEQNKLQQESAGISAAAAKKQYELNQAMLVYQEYVDHLNAQNGLALLNTNLSNLASTIQSLTSLLGGSNSTTTSSYIAPPGTTVIQGPITTTTSSTSRQSNSSSVNVQLYLDGKKVTDYVANGVVK